MKDELGNYWLGRYEKLLLFEVVHPNESNGTDGTPMVRLHTFVSGHLHEYDDWQTIEDARKLWYNMIGQGYQRVEAQWDEKTGATRV